MCKNVVTQSRRQSARRSMKTLPANFQTIRVRRPTKRERRYSGGRARLAQRLPFRRRVSTLATYVPTKTLDNKAN